MPDLSRAGIDFDEVRVSSLCLQHEIKTVKSGKIEAASHRVRSSRHFRVLDRAHYRGVPSRTCLVDYLKMEASEDATVPADNGAGGFASGHERLGVDHGPTTQD